MSGPTPATSDASPRRPDDSDSAPRGGPAEEEARVASPPLKLSQQWRKRSGTEATATPAAHDAAADGDAAAKRPAPDPAMSQRLAELTRENERLKSELEQRRDASVIVAGPASIARPQPDGDNPFAAAVEGGARPDPPCIQSAGSAFSAPALFAALSGPPGPGLAGLAGLLYPAQALPLGPEPGLLGPMALLGPGALNGLSMASLHNLQAILQQQQQQENAFPSFASATGLSGADPAKPALPGLTPAFEPLAPAMRFEPLLGRRVAKSEPGTSAEPEAAARARAKPQTAAADSQWGEGSPNPDVVPVITRGFTTGLRDDRVVVTRPEREARPRRLKASRTLKIAVSAPGALTKGGSLAERSFQRNVNSPGNLHLVDQLPTAHEPRASVLLHTADSLLGQPTSQHTWRAEPVHLPRPLEQTGPALPSTSLLGSLLAQSTRRSPAVPESRTDKLSGLMDRKGQPGHELKCPLPDLNLNGATGQAKSDSDSLGSPHSTRSTTDSNRSQNSPPLQREGGQSAGAGPERSDMEKVRSDRSLNWSLQYMDRRRRNNEAAKRCRANRRRVFEYRSQRAAQLEAENNDLRQEMIKLSGELEQLKAVIQANQQRILSA